MEVIHHQILYHRYCLFCAPNLKTVFDKMALDRLPKTTTQLRVRPCVWLSYARPTDEYKLVTEQCQGVPKIAHQPTLLSTS
jgi:hypothetical protein